MHRYAGTTIDFKHYLNQQTDFKWPSTVITISIIWKEFVEEEMLQGLEKDKWQFMEVSWLISDQNNWYCCRAVNISTQFLEKSQFEDT